MKKEHISEEKDFSRNLWKQSIGRVSCSSSCEDKNRQYPTHKSLPDHNVTTSNFLQNIFPKTFLTDFPDFLNFFSNIRHRRFILTFYKKCFFPSFPKFWCPSRKSVQNHSLISSKLFQSLYSPTFFRYSPQMSNIYNSVDQNVAISFLVQKIFSPFLLFADSVKLFSSVSKTRVSLATTFITLMLRLHFQYSCQLQRAQSWPCGVDRRHKESNFRFAIVSPRLPFKTRYWSWVEQSLRLTTKTI